MQLRNAAPDELKNLRCALEHRTFRDFFYNYTKTFLNYLMSADDAAYTLYQMAFEYEGLSLPYAAEAFRIRYGMVAEGVRMVSLELPEPESEQLCYRIHFVTDTNYENPKMYTIERRAEGGSLSGWTRDAHVDYHSVAEPKFEGKGKAAMIALEAFLVSEAYSGKYDPKEAAAKPGDVC